MSTFSVPGARPGQRSAVPGLHVHGPTPVSSTEPRREQIGVPEHETEADGLAGHLADVAAACPGDDSLDLVSENLGAVLQRKPIDGLATLVLNLHADAAGGGR